MKFKLIGPLLVLLLLCSLMVSASTSSLKPSDMTTDLSTYNEVQQDISWWDKFLSNFKLSIIDFDGAGTPGVNSDLVKVVSNGYAIFTDADSGATCSVSVGDSLPTYNSDIITGVTALCYTNTDYTGEIVTHYYYEDRQGWYIDSVKYVVKGDEACWNPVPQSSKNYLSVHSCDVEVLGSPNDITRPTEPIDVPTVTNPSTTSPSNDTGSIINKIDANLITWMVIVGLLIAGIVIIVKRRFIK